MLWNDAKVMTCTPGNRCVKYCFHAAATSSPTRSTLHVCQEQAQLNHRTGLVEHENDLTAQLLGDKVEERRRKVDGLVRSWDSRIMQAGRPETARRQSAGQCR